MGGASRGWRRRWGQSPRRLLGGTRPDETPFGEFSFGGDACRAGGRAGGRRRGAELVGEGAPRARGRLAGRPAARARGPCGQRERSSPRGSGWDRAGGAGGAPETCRLRVVGASWGPSLWPWLAGSGRQPGASASSPRAGRALRAGSRAGAGAPRCAGRSLFGAPHPSHRPAGSPPLSPSLGFP